MDNFKTTEQKLWFLKGRQSIIKDFQANMKACIQKNEAITAETVLDWIQKVIDENDEMLKLFP